jgi:hypothetical protein
MFNVSGCGEIVGWFAEVVFGLQLTKINAKMLNTITIFLITILFLQKYYFFLYFLIVLLRFLSKCRTFKSSRVKVLRKCRGLLACNRSAALRGGGVHHRSDEPLPLQS